MAMHRNFKGGLRRDLTDSGGQWLVEHSYICHHTPISSPHPTCPACGHNSNSII